jgi:prophage antirepressor-like protein
MQFIVETIKTKSKMSNQSIKVQLIKHPQFGEIRTQVDKKGNVLFCLADVCEVLGIENPSYVKKRLNPRGVVLNYPIPEKGVGSTDTLTEGGSQQLNFIDEPNLYRCIFRSRKPEAVKFQDWVFEEVLPAIRKFGYYVHPSCMEAKDVRKLGRTLLMEMRGYITEEDIVKTGKKFGKKKWDIEDILMGYKNNNAIMQELQRRAISNREKEINAYDPERMIEVIKKLNN